MPGFRLGQKWNDKLGMRASNTSELVFDETPVPAANLMGKPGDGTLHMMRNLELERLVLAAQSVGIAQRCIEVMLEYSGGAQSLRPTDPILWSDSAPHRRGLRRIPSGAFLSFTTWRAVSI